MCSTNILESKLEGKWLIWNGSFLGLCHNAAPLWIRNRIVGLQYSPSGKLTEKGFLLRRKKKRNEISFIRSEITQLEVDINTQNFQAKTMEMFVYSQVKQKHVALFLSFLRYGPLTHRIHLSDSVLFGSSSPKGWGVSIFYL